MAVNAFDYCRMTKQRVQAPRTINAKLFKKGAEPPKQIAPASMGTDRG
jgi:hypothetical protein